MAARRSHPPTLITLARRLILDEALIEPQTLVLVAVSGGPDSMALLHVLAGLRQELRFELAAHGVDHGLRAEAASELGLAAGLARGLGVPWGETRVEVAPGGNLQARAREVRHAALAEAARAAGATCIATGHHADDRAETVLLRLLQGSGPRGLGCLPPRHGALIRPFLRARRGDIQAHVNRHKVPFAEDPSNNNSRFFRARIRGELMPLLESMSPSVVAHLNALADELSGAKTPVDAETPADTVALGRAQREQLRAAERAGKPGVRLRVAGGQEVWVAVAKKQDMLSYKDMPTRAGGDGDERSSTPGRGGGTLRLTRARSTVVGPSKVRS